MTFKKIMGKLHLWLGLTSGLVVFIVAITGCIFVFQKEIQDLTQPYRFVKPSQQEFLLPSQLRASAQKELPDKKITTVYYNKKDEAAIVVFFERDPLFYNFVYVNPYTAEVLHIKDMTTDFFTIIMHLHYRLLLPEEIGTTIVDYASLIFLIMMISGLYLWWPRNKNAKKQRFKIRWNVRWKRKNYDLHNVFGFYMTWIAIFIVFTGLMWGFEWIADPIYSAVTGGKEIVEYYVPPSDTTKSKNNFELISADKVWKKVVEEETSAVVSGVFYPAKNNPAAAITIYTNPDNVTFYKREFRHFDQYTLEELPANHYWADYEKANAGDMLERMLYDIHIGAILGLPGKILAFFGSLVAASLPVTGFLIWLGRKKKKIKSVSIKKNVRTN